MNRNNLFGLFQSTLPREERPTQRIMKNKGLIFQSTLPREERQERSFLMETMWWISIHAPTRGATVRLIKRHKTLLFQSTLPREERRYSKLTYEEYIEFQSTLPREERRKLHCISGKIHVHFNPRSHERSDYTRVKEGG